MMLIIGSASSIKAGAGTFLFGIQLRKSSIVASTTFGRTDIMRCLRLIALENILRKCNVMSASVSISAYPNKLLIRTTPFPGAVECRCDSPVREESGRGLSLDGAVR